jgi:hypothetical protein
VGTLLFLHARSTWELGSERLLLGQPHKPTVSRKLAPWSHAQEAGGWRLCSPRQSGAPDTRCLKTCLSVAFATKQLGVGLSLPINEP